MRQGLSAPRQIWGRRTAWLAGWFAAGLVGSVCWAAPAPNADPVADLLRNLNAKSAQNKVEPSPPAAPTNLQNDVVVHAMSMVGVLYRRGGNSEAAGFDCSGLVQFIYGETAAIVLPRRANEQAQQGIALPFEADLQPGDLVFYNTLKRPFSHVGIYVGQGQFVHSPRTGAKVRLERMGDAYWTRRYEGARRLMGSPDR